MGIGHPLPAQHVLTNIDTTARKKTRSNTLKQNATPRGATIQKGKRMEVLRSALTYAIPCRCSSIRTIGTYVYGTVLGPKPKSGKYWVHFDELPAEHNGYFLVRENLTVSTPGEGESAYGDASEDAAENAERCSGQEKTPKIKPAQDAIDAFLVHPPEEQNSAKSFIYPYGPNVNESISWKTLE